MAEELTGSMATDETMAEKLAGSMATDEVMFLLKVRHVEGKHHANNNPDPLYLNWVSAKPVIVGNPGGNRTSLLVSGDMIVGAGGNGFFKARHLEGKHHANDNADPLYLNWISAKPVIVGNPGGNKTLLLVSGDLTVGAGGNGLVKTRHVEGKHFANDNPDPLYLNWYNGQPVHIGGPDRRANLHVSGDILLGSNTAPANLHVSGDIFLSSDARLKTDVHDIIGALEKLQKVRGVRFVRRDADSARNGGAGLRDMGVIAQEVEAIFPELVHSPDDESYKAVNYNGLIGVLIEATKELKAEKEALRRRIEALESALGE